MRIEFKNASIFIWTYRSFYGIACIAEGVEKMAKITLRDIYWDKYSVCGMAMGDLVNAMQNGLSIENHKEFYEVAVIRHTILTIEQILKEDSFLSDIDTELLSCCE